MYRRLLASLALLAALPAAAATSAPAPRPVVVELFTSEGCSSCPPADAFLSDLSQKRDDLLPLAFHVTYWNNLGWKDPYSLDIATERQAAYAHRFGDGSYTPEMVVDGTVGFVGSDRSAAEVAFREAKDAGSTAATVTGVRKGNAITVSVGSGVGNARVVLVGYDPQHVTPVGRGENSGRTLTESNIVRSYEPIGQWSGKAATFTPAAPTGEKTAVLLEAPDGRIVGAARVSNEP
ncbi:DUF1223 domain-containing protein [Paraburkholderia sp. SOS3]|jgi:hypothetical protein|uniref:DUF1223 domain-containing protein n=1 Tax=Paraburkholderia sp. SOS3 TaxID=1926494 RepID=UPI0009473018|nr:DUF1223 domain-containing protein [Paraburkholderia sp. SOS3]APR35121.1 DUF1223 domain-containing protein [Paraburkholderia sp. SOS3]